MLAWIPTEFPCRAVSCRAAGPRRHGSPSHGEAGYRLAVISDRDYMREMKPRGPGLAVKLIWVLLACFIVQSVLAFHGRVDVAGALGLSKSGLLHGRIWTLITYQFLHSVPLPFHVLANGLGLYFFGRSVEEQIGTRRFAWLYLLGGVLGGLAQVLIDGIFGRETTVVGASAGVCAVVATYCRLFPERQAMFSLYFIPIEMRATVLLWVLLAYDAWCALFPMDGVAHLAHLGGYGTGMAAVAWMNAEDGWPTRWWRRRMASRPRVTVINGGKGQGPTRASGGQGAAGGRKPADWSREIDPILDKIATQGIHSLTSEERAKLERVRRQMGGN